MRILFVTYGLPYPLNSGARIRDFNIIKNISTQHSVSLLSLLEFPEEATYISELEKYCESVDVVIMKRRSVWEHFAGLVNCLHTGRPVATHPFYYSDMAYKIRTVVSKVDFDIIQIEHSFLAPYIKVLPENNKYRKILSFQNVGVKQYRRMLSLHAGFKDRIIFLLKWMLMRNWEAKYAELFDHCLVVSDDESRLLHSLNSRLSITVIDNGVDTELLQPLSDATEEHALLFVGTMGYPPNVDAILYFLKSILPLIEERVPDVKLYVVGRYPADEIRRHGKKKNIVITEEVSDVLPFYQKSKVSIVPLRAGGGSRLKILEAMALGRPVVSTTIGAEGLRVTDQENILVADTPSEFADAVVRLLEEQKLWEKISGNARRFVQEHYDWTMISNKLLNLYGNLLK